MITFYDIDKIMGVLTGHLGIYRLDAGDNFFFEGTKDFYNGITRGTVDCLNNALDILARHIGAKSVPIIEPWKGSSNPLAQNDYDWTKSKEPPGMIKYSGSDRSRIEINIVNIYSPYILGAILAHELTHHYLDSRGVRLPVINDNERLVDMATAYLGLGKMTLNGYEPLKWAMQTSQGTVEYTYQVGYLSAEEMAKVMAMVVNFRNINIHKIHENLTEKASSYLRIYENKFLDYKMKKQMAGDIACPNCNAVSRFSFSAAEDGLYCSSCSLEYDECLRKGYKKRSSLIERIKSYISST